MLIAFRPHKVALVITPLVFGLIMFAGWFGQSFQETHVAMRGFGVCPPPCWNTIRPGEMSIGEADRILIDDQYQRQVDQRGRPGTVYLLEDTASGCTVRLERQGGAMTEVRLLDCPALRLGDLIPALGHPQSLLPHSMTISFEGGMARIRLKLDPCKQRISPFSEVMFVRFARTPGILPNEVEWRGFIPARQYAQRFPYDSIPLAC